MSEPNVRTAESAPVGLYIPSSLLEIDPSATIPPTQDELPYDDEEPLESQRHLFQIMLLIETLKQHWADRDDFFAGGNMFVYFSTAQIKKNDFRGPDFFVATGVDGKRERKSWVVWEEGKSPDMVIEFLSESTADFDCGAKMKIYHDRVRVPEYFYYDPFAGELAGFITNGLEYQSKAPDEDGRLICNATGLALVAWQGEYLGLHSQWLRWETSEGELVPTEAELAERLFQRAEQERQRAERMAAKLRELGVDPTMFD